VRNVIVRGGYRLIPWWCRRALYKPVVAHFAERLERGETGGPGGPSSGAEDPGDPGYPEISAAGFWRDERKPVRS